MTPDELEAFLELEARWEEAHRELRRAFLSPEPASPAFWSRVEELAERAESLGRALDATKRIADFRRLAGFVPR